MKRICLLLIPFLLAACDEVTSAVDPDTIISPPMASIEQMAEVSPEAALWDTRATFLNPDPEGGPIIFEFYRDGTGLLAFDETAERGQTDLRWEIKDGQFCLMEDDLTRRDCSAYTLEGRTLTIGTFGDMIGTIAPL